jgi:hypothetical protein
MQGCTRPRSGDSPFCGQSHVDRSPEAQAARDAHVAAHPETLTGSAAIICPHCQLRGHVSTTAVKVKRGISGGKATGAVLTAGVSLLATGLSRKERATQFKCGNCHVSWLA